MRALFWVIIAEFILFGISIAVMAIIYANNSNTAHSKSQQSKLHSHPAKDVVVLLTDKNYVDKFEKTVSQIRTTGRWNGDIVCMHPSDLSNHKRFAKLCHELRISPYLVRGFDLSQVQTHIKINPFSHSDGREFNKTVQWLKLYMFSIFFKQWKHVLYLDVGMKINSSIHRFFNLPMPTSGIMAHSDAYPTFKWKLSNQFDKTESNANKAIYDRLSAIYDLETDYFQTTLVAFYTSIITDSLFDEILQMLQKFPICRTNEQALINLIFHGNWQQIPVKDNEGYLYDYIARKPGTKYAMLKS